MEFRAKSDVVIETININLSLGPGFESHRELSTYVFTLLPALKFRTD